MSGHERTIELGQHRKIKSSYGFVHLESYGSNLTAFLGSGRVSLDYGETRHPVIDTYDLHRFLEEVDRATGVMFSTEAALKALRENGKATGWEEAA